MLIGVDQGWSGLRQLVDAQCNHLLVFGVILEMTLFQKTRKNITNLKPQGTKNRARKFAIHRGNGQSQVAKWCAWCPS